MHDRGEIVVSTCVFLFFTVFIAVATTYSSEARLMPLVVGIPAWLLSVLQLRADVRQVLGRITPHAKAAALTSASKMLLWFSGAVLATLALGILLAAAFFVLLYLRVQHGAAWRVAVIVAASFAASLYALVTLVLDIELMSSVFSELM